LQKKAIYVSIFIEEKVFIYKINIMNWLKCFLNSQEWINDVDNITDNDKKNFASLIKWRHINKKVIKPVENLIDVIDKMELSFYLVLELYDQMRKKQDTKKTLNTLSNIIWIENISESMMGKIWEKDISINQVIDFYKKSILPSITSTSNNKLLNQFFVMMENEVDNIALNTGLSVWDYNEVPSFEVFINVIKKELSEYLQKLYFIDVLWEDDVLSKIKIVEWLKEEKKSESSYIKLPFFHEIYETIEQAERPGKVGQVVIKGPPWTWKTRIFEFLWDKRWRKTRVISMHQYINFYELLMQNTNLAPTKNRVDSINVMIDQYKDMEPEMVVEEFKLLFRKNKDLFPEDYQELDFVNNIFSNIPNGKKWHFEKLETLDNASDVKDFVLKSLNFWRSEENFGLLLNKKEIVSWVLLSCIKNGEIPVLDEIDKIKEEEIEGILAFLDLETWKPHKIGSMEKEVFIPEWFWVYAQNTLLYILSRVLNDDLDIQFDDQELEQLLTSIEIIEEKRDSKDYHMMDFSIRMIDNFLNGFVKFKNGNIQKNYHVSNRSTYILEALRKAFEVQIEDVYGHQYDKKKSWNIWTQQSEIIGDIDEAILAKQWKNEIQTGLKISKWTRTQVLYLLRKLNLNNPILKRLAEEDLESKETELFSPRELNFSNQIQGVMSTIDNSIPVEKRQQEEEYNGFKVEDYNNEIGDIHISFSYDEKEFKYSKNGWKDWIVRECIALSVNSDQRSFIIKEWENRHIKIDVESDGELWKIGEIQDYNEYYFYKNKTVIKKWEKIHFSSDLVMNKPEDAEFKIIENYWLWEILSPLELDLYVLDPRNFSKAFGRDFDIWSEDKDGNNPHILNLHIRDLGYVNWEATIKWYSFDKTKNYVFIKVEDKNKETFTHVINL